MTCASARLRGLIRTRFQGQPPALSFDAWTPARTLARIVTALLVAFAAPGLVSAQPARFEIDPEHLSVGFLVSHVGYADVLGMFEAEPTQAGVAVIDSVAVEVDHVVGLMFLAGSVELLAQSRQRGRTERVDVDQARQ